MYEWRHTARAQAMQALYSDEFRDRIGVEPFAESNSSWWLESGRDEVKAYSLLLYYGVHENREKIDELISSHSKTRAIIHMSIVDLSVIRLGVYSLLFDKDVASKVVIDESVKLSLEYSNGVGFKFVNGVLDAIAKELAA
ncbi:MAG TPA: transcription antitermination factor NusB [Spirochaetaceae bacterium]|nr:transcription antitermination factor NusB [Spirochaetaceae bacterium]